MTYIAFSAACQNAAIKQDEETKVWYLLPDWRAELYNKGLYDLSKIDCPFISNWDEIEDILKLAVKYRNDCDSRRGAVLDWIADGIFEKKKQGIPYKPYDVQPYEDYFDSTPYELSNDDE